MIIQGFQKLTLLDYPETMACTIFTGGCNFRCPFCHNASLVIGEANRNVISEDEIFSYLRKRRGILEGVCVTGGEPLIQSGIENFLSQIKELGFKVKLDTNGSFLERMIYLIEKGLVDYVAMDIKNSKSKYGKTCGLENLSISDIEKSVEYLINGKIEYEFRTTVVREFHKENDFAEIGEWIKGTKRYYLQAFVDSGDLIGNNISGYTKEEMESFKMVLKPYIFNVEVRGI